MKIGVFDRVQGPTGRFDLRVFRHGRLIERVSEPNLIVVGAPAAHAQLVGGNVAGNSVTQIGYGSSTLPPVVGNASLSTPFLKAVDGVSYPAASQVQFAFSLLATEDNGAMIGEFGLLTAAGVLYARKARTTPLSKDSTLSLSGTWTIIF